MLLGQFIDHDFLATPVFTLNGSVVGGDLLPQVDGSFISGDGRLGENPGLTFLHTVWTREHNRVAKALARKHYDWDEERLFQEARRIVIGEYQHIIYNEYLPVVLGTQYTCDHGLEPVHGPSFQYSDQVDPTIKTEFSTAAFRFGHSQVHDAFVLRSETGKITETLALENTFFLTNLIEAPGAVAQFARALTDQKPRLVDSTFVPAIHEKLFARGAPFGLDLIALNINRGRDHGLPSYVTVLQNCLRQSLPNSWSALKPFFEPDVLQRLQSVYYSIYDIELFIGGVSEKRKPGALVGEVFQCIIGEQFFNTRYGDRYFYDNGGQPHSFSHKQLREIQKASWARILCDNVKELDKMQPMALWQPCVSYNRRQHCGSHAIPQVKLNVF
ncbi:peroxidase-like [Pollicipes pollicipes]|uniref:peroxidase-like n=1 Tax=Pollicipes pollicipes TaxID=41117 RepID=UPI001885A09F|nr:peroxidase-like [Pollicipes pollicipes]